MGSISDSMSVAVLSSLEGHLKKLHIHKYVLNVPGKLQDPNYAEWKINYTSQPAEPLAIIRPQSAEDVATLVSYCVEQKLDFHIRVGGHDLFGRSTIQDSIMIDLRDINYVSIKDDKSTARVGGGILFERLHEELAKENMFTPTGVIGTVGYVGWSCLGGYSPFCPRYGLGLDQIVGAKLVTADGKIIQADKSMMKGIRGGCGNFGVIVEVTSKIYPLPQVKAGPILFESSNLQNTFRAAMNNYQKLLASKTPPNELYIAPMVLKFPSLGPTFFIDFAWSGPETAETEEWHTEIARLAPMLSGEIAEKKPLDIIRETTQMLPAAVLGGPNTAYLRNITPEVVEVMAKHIGLMPNDPSAGFVIHACRGKSCEPPFPDSVWSYRESHLLVEILGMASAEDDIQANRTWAENFRIDLVKTDGALEGSYVSLTPPKFLDLQKTFGENLTELKKLKEEYDPNRVFKHAIPPL